MNSLRMSFWMVPESWSCPTPCSSAATTYPASTGSTAPFIVIDGVDRDAGHPDVAGNARMIAVVSAVGGQVERHRQPHLPCGQVPAVEGVRLLGGREPRVLPDGPR